MRPHMDNSNNSFGYTSTTRPTWETARPQPPPRRRANSLQSASTVTSTNMRPTRRSLFNTTVVCIFQIYHSFKLTKINENKQFGRCVNGSSSWRKHKTSDKHWKWTNIYTNATPRISIQSNCGAEWNTFRYLCVFEMHVFAQVLSIIHQNHCKMCVQALT